MASNIRVVTRVRPLSSNEKAQGCADVLKVSPQVQGSDPTLTLGGDDKVSHLKSPTFIKFGFIPPLDSLCIYN
jgi:hypothetical protein